MATYKPGVSTSSCYQHPDVRATTKPPDMDGLLGLSFLARFEMKLDAKAGRLELSEHKPR